MNMFFKFVHVDYFSLYLQSYLLMNNVTMKLIEHNMIDNAHYRNVDISYEDGELMVMSDLMRYIKENFNNDKARQNQVGWVELLFCLDGNFQWEVNGVYYQMARSSVIIMPTHYVDNLMMSLDAKMVDVRMSLQLLYRLLGSDIDSWQKIISGFEVQTMQLDIELMDRLLDYFYLIHEQIEAASNYSDKIIQSIVRVILYTVLNGFLVKGLSRGDEMNVNVKVSQSKRLFDNFLKLLSQTKPKRHPIGFYAEKLSVSTKYLSNTCIKYSNRTAADWIQEAVQEEVRYYLKQTLLPIKDVAHVTGFGNVAFFGKYVKQHFGYTPLVYRRKNR